MGVQMDRVYLHWNIINWITVFLMAYLGMMAVAFVGSAIRARNGGGSE